MVEFAPIKIGQSCTAGSDLIINAGVVMEDGSTVGTLSSVGPRQQLPANSTWLGNPAVLCGITRDDDEEQTLLLQQLARGDAAKEEVGEAHFCLVATTMVLFPIFMLMLSGVLVAGVYLTCTFILEKQRGLSVIAKFGIVVFHTVALFRDLRIHEAQN